MGAFKCCACNDTFACLDSLEAHVASKHVLYNAYECEECENALFPTDHSLREHYFKIHKRTIFTIKYRVSPELEQRRELLRQMMYRSQISDTGCGQNGSSCTEMFVQNAYSAMLSNLAESNELLAKCKANNNVPNEYEDRQPSETDNSIDRLMHAANSILNDSSNSDGRNPGQMLEFGSSSTKERKQYFLNYGSPQDVYPVRGLFSEMCHLSSTVPTHSANGVKTPNNKTNRRKRKKPEPEGTPIKDEEGTAMNHTVQSHVVRMEDFNGEGGKRDRGPMVECPSCKRSVGRYKNSMLIHVSTHHTEEPIYECLGINCNKKWFSLSARTKEHIRSKHDGDFSLLKDNRPALLPELKATAKRLFPVMWSSSL